MTDTTFSGSATALADFSAGPARAPANGLRAPHSTACQPIYRLTNFCAELHLWRAAGDCELVYPDYDGGAWITCYTAASSPGGVAASCATTCSSILFIRPRREKAQ